MNLIDGLDGLAAGVSAIASVTVIMVALQQGMYPVAIMTASLAGAIIGFIRYNFNPATIFMGDTGSLFWVTCWRPSQSLALSRVQRPLHFWSLPLPWGFPLWIRPLPFCVAIKWPAHFQPDKGHIHHRLLAMGFSQRQAVIFMYLISAGLCLAAVLLTEVDGVYALVLLGVLITIIFIGAKKIGILKDR